MFGALNKLVKARKEFIVYSDSEDAGKARELFFDIAEVVCNNQKPGAFVGEVERGWVTIICINPVAWPYANQELQRDSAVQ